MTEATPRFVEPTPSRTQKLSMRAAGMLLGQKGSADTLHALTTDVGGFEAVQKDGKTVYTTEGDTTMTALNQDETTGKNHTHARRFKTGADFEDSTGRELDTAVGRVVDGARKGGPKAKSFRGRAATRLVRRATKGVRPRSHLN